MPKLSLAMIVRNEEQNLPRCLASVAQHVDEIVIVDTGSVDRTKEIAASFGALVLDFNPQTNPNSFFMDDESTGAPPPYTGKPALGDFSAARSLSFSAVTGDYVIWLDADDVLEGADQLRGVIDQMESGATDVAWLPYHYGHDPAGRVICLLWRERIIRRGSMRWVNPIHEVLIPTVADVKSFRVGNMTVRHCRTAERQAGVANRNYKVLLRHVGRGEDARTLFYFGNEARNVNPDQAMNAYERYVEISGWPEERCIARCYMGEICESRGQIGRAEAHFAAATIESVDLPDGWFGLARIAFHKNAWADCVRLTEQGLRRGNPETVIMINPLGRTFGPYIYYNVALNALGRVQEAYDACAKGLEVVSDDPGMRHNLALYRSFLDMQAAAGGLTSGVLSLQAREGMLLGLSAVDIETAPTPMSDVLLRRASLRLWKECLAGGEPRRAMRLLDSLPESIRHHAEVTDAVSLTLGAISQHHSEPSCDSALNAMAAMERYVPGRDVVLIDTIDRTWHGPASELIQARMALKEGGKVIAICPSSKKANGWLDQEGRLYRSTYRSIRLALRSAELQPSQIRQRRIAGESALVVVASPSKDPEPGSLDIVIWTGPAVEPWSPDSPETTGIGGSETACIEMAKHLASFGHRVTVYGDCKDREGCYDGVDYMHHETFVSANCDVFISSRAPSIVDRKIDAKLKLLWVHDVHVGQPGPDMHRWLLRFDRILCLSEWHKHFFLSVYPHVHPGTVTVTRNGIDPARFTGELEMTLTPTKQVVGLDFQCAERLPKKRNKLVYSSSANRGLDVLLDVFPRIRAEVPDAELHVFYGFESWEATARMTGNTTELAVIAEYKRRLENTAGVVVRGRVSQAELAREMMTAKVWSYPTGFTETYCCGVVEAQAAGCIPVTSALAALTETGRWGVLLPGPNTAIDYQDAFVREVVGLLKNDERHAAVAAAGRQWALRLSWESLAVEWASMFRDLIVECGIDTPRYEQKNKQEAA